MVENRYDHKQIESKWQKFWEQEKIFRAETGSGDPKFYILDMFAYPSGDGLHAGHPRSYTATDILSRMYRMKGYNVLHPIGWDAFGLPAENYAIKIGVHPREATDKNIVNFTRQIKSFGFSYDWSREINTSRPNYYKWTQWIFKTLYDAGLAYQKETHVNWCPKCQTVLANEQVVGGMCEHCQTQVEQKKLKQWFFKITDFAEDLINGLDKVDWPDSTKEMQKNWIGRSEGAEIQFQIPNTKYQIKVFTTRADTLFGATYMVLAPEHELVKKITTQGQKQKVGKYVKDAQLKSSLDRTAVKEKTGVFTGAYAINPANQEKIPIWIADYVLASYGFGAVMAVPAHDQRDFEFAAKYDLPAKMVVCPNYPAPTCPVLDYAYKDDGYLVASGKFDGMKNREAAAKITDQVGGKITVQYKLHDWLVSRQRYWGAPIPIIYKDGKPVSVDEKDLPVLLPEDVDFKPGGESPLVSSKKFHKDFTREVDTLDTFVCSSWYFLRYCDPHNISEFAGKKSLKYWMPVDFYIGGAEHTNGHLLYSRFIVKALHKLGYLDFDEPFLKLRHQGLILGPDGEKMSKSRGNVVNPDDLIKRYGADTVRMYEMFMGPFDQHVAWDTNGVSGVRRFLDKVYKLANERGSSSDITLEEESRLHQLTKKITEDIEKTKFNTAVSAFMEFINDMSQGSHGGWLRNFVKLLSPFAPHLSEELWQNILDEKQSVLKAGWPVWDPQKVVVKEVTIIVQERGKLRGTIQMSSGASKAQVLKTIDKNTRLAELAKKYKKRVFVKDRIINFV